MLRSARSVRPLFLLPLLVACAGGLRGSASSGSTALGIGVVPPTGETLRVQSDLRVRPGAYVRPAPGADGAILLEGLRGVTLDLTGVELRGAPAGTELDRLAGHGIVLRDCEDVTIRGGTLGGYKGCIVAERCNGLTIVDVRFEGWYGMRLRSTPAGEDPSDWLWPHENDRGEWLERYGAALSCTDCSGVVIDGSSGRDGQNGILLTRVRDARVYDNDFSFLSGWGLALYRSSHNLVCRNRFDYCVRGYSHGVYWRGQDSAGMLVFERCSDNVFALNSATHGGDGLFLYGGQDLVQGRALERGEVDAGGADRNVFWRNDFSHAVANAVEATFSGDNWVIENRLLGSHQHGVWGGYSHHMVVLRNEIEDTLGGAVSIEHGQECVIAENAIRGNDIGVELWWDEDPELVDGPFGRARDTASRDQWILENRFADNVQDLVLGRTERVRLAGNEFAGPHRGSKIVELRVLEADERTESAMLASIRGMTPGGPTGFFDRSSLLPPGSATELPEPLRRARAWQPPELPGESDPLALSRGARQGLQTIVMGEWGPWDFESGAPRPAVHRAGGVLADLHWEALWFGWADAVDPREDYDAWRALRFQPVARRQIATPSSPWGGSPEVRATVGAERFGLVATAELSLAEGGRFRLSVVSDDGVRIAVDGKRVLENWTWHAPTRDEVELELEPGAHRFELDYFQIDGAAALTLDLDRVSSAPSSKGPSSETP